MDYLDEEKKKRILENNRLLSGKFIEEDRQAQLAKFKRDVECIRKLTSRPRRTLAGYLVKKITGQDPAAFIVRGVTKVMADKHRKDRTTRKRIADIFKKRRK